jgi:hypothetical protein
MRQRELNLRTIDDCIAELDRLEKSGCTPQGNWDFAQVCNHLSFFIEGGLDGYKFKVPWIFKALFGKMVLKRILTQRKMKSGQFTPQKPLPEPGGDPKAAASRLRTALIITRDHQGDFVPSPFFGYLTPEQARDLAVIHCAHHFAFLEPK